MKTVIEVLKESRALIEKGWCQIHTAVNHSGQSTWTGCPTACKWCAFGAVMAVTGDWNKPYAILRDLTVGSLAEWNDAPGRTQAEVLDLFDRAIAKAESEAPNA